MSAQEQLQDMQRQQIAALQIEVLRLNCLIKDFKTLALKATITDPNFDKPLSEIETNFEIVKHE
tara:strand:- start:257 stop:448 length:192 start_codon:yes stop_codon:yes gene_type:complete